MHDNTTGSFEVCGIINSCSGEQKRKTNYGSSLQKDWIKAKKKKPSLAKKQRRKIKKNKQLSTTSFIYFIIIS